jgi:hypothetical protein
MKIYGNPIIESESCDNFSYVTENINSIIDELQEKVDYKLRENERRESDSIMHATQFITTIQ